MEGGQGSYLVIIRRRQLKGYLEIAMTDTLLLSSEDSSSSDEEVVPRFVDSQFVGQATPTPPMNN